MKLTKFTSKVTGLNMKNPETYVRNEVSSEPMCGSLDDYFWGPMITFFLLNSLKSDFLKTFFFNLRLYSIGEKVIKKDTEVLSTNTK